MRMQKPWTVQLEDLWVIKGIHLFKVKKLSFLMKNVQKNQSQHCVFFGEDECVCIILYRKHDDKK
jgi:hypothetical protein